MSLKTTYRWKRKRRTHDPKYLRIPWDLTGCTVTLAFRDSKDDDGNVLFTLTNSSGLTLETLAGTPVKTKLVIRDLTVGEENQILALPTQSVYSDLEIKFPSESLPRKPIVIQLYVEKDILP